MRGIPQNPGLGVVHPTVSQHSPWQCGSVPDPLTCVCFFCLDNIIKRIFNILKFTWVLFLATVDSFTTWLNSISREHIDISTVLRIERCMLTREIKKVIPLTACHFQRAAKSTWVVHPSPKCVRQEKFHVSSFGFGWGNIFTQIMKQLGEGTKT